jgi:hypothetical protein
MLWGNKSIDDWGVVKKGYATAALGCNEYVTLDQLYAVFAHCNPLLRVDHGDQANMTPQEGINIWQQYLAPLIDDGYTLYSHSVTNAPSGFDWWDRFKEGCPKCHEQIGAMAVHYYSVSWLRLLLCSNRSHGPARRARQTA